MPGKVRRLLDLYKLLWADERLSALEAKADRMHSALRYQRERADRIQSALRCQRERADRMHSALRYQRERADRMHSALRYQQERFLKQRNILQTQLDSLKSSLEVPRELVQEYFEWRTHNPIPERPLISVVTATYNRARVLTQRCIPSVLGQTYQNIEMIVVGDACTDETEAAVAKIRDPRLRFVNLPERGTYPSDSVLRRRVAGTLPTNKALSMARGDFISHLDDDDEYAPNRIEELVNLAVENDSDLVWHPFWWEEESGDSWRLYRANEFALGQVTNGSVLYRSWFKRFKADIGAHLLSEPGDWNRFRKIKYVNPPTTRHPDPLLRKHRGNV